jgi:glycosyltransferase involved in cell wall biosynthesis
VNGKGLLCSVVIPAFNEARTLGRCLAALARQSVPCRDFDVIVVDDGSSDDTGRIAREFSEGGLRVRCAFQTNSGPAAARNRGASMALADLVLFTDADCEPEETWVAAMTRPFADPEVDGVKGAYRTRQRELAARFAQAEFDHRFALLKKHRTIDMVDTYSAGYRKQVFLEAGGFDTSFPGANNEDTELSYRLARQGRKLVFSPEAVVRHTHPTTLGRYLAVKFGRGYWRMVVYARYPDKAVKDSYTPTVIKVQTLLAALSFALIPAGLAWAPALAAAGVLTVLIVITALPFSLEILGRDPVLGGVAPFFCLFRAWVFAAGSLKGAVALTLGRVPGAGRGKPGSA